jgi:hypothetical protein
MRRAIVIGVVLLAIVTGIGIGAYNLGVNEGISQGLERNGQVTEVVRVVGPGFHAGYGFFPFGLLLFPLLVIGTILLVRGAFWRGRWGGPPTRRYGYGPGPWGWGGPPAPESWPREEREPGERPGGREEPPGA